MESSGIFDEKGKWSRGEMLGKPRWEGNRWFYTYLRGLCLYKDNIADICTDIEWLAFMKVIEDFTGEELKTFRQMKKNASIYQHIEDALRGNAQSMRCSVRWKWWELSAAATYEARINARVRMEVDETEVDQKKGCARRFEVSLLFMQKKVSLIVRDGLPMAAVLDDKLGFVLDQQAYKLVKFQKSTQHHTTIDKCLGRNSSNL